MIREDKGEPDQISVLLIRSSRRNRELLLTKVRFTLFDFDSISSDGGLDAHISGVNS